ncbi:hypothetical protein SCHPADRAFT_885208 [Schizopora paradoxa]|uniref:Uncharacterized protein n=1 Tax=Schizopora paradoxa TaxID=27342 RepID=A0A0H2S5Q8_9AGAM|nr:hypothetical protein SCHPADRAFT_885208 [Schizopora paradoxa]
MEELGQIVREQASRPGFNFTIYPDSIHQRDGQEIGDDTRRFTTGYFHFVDGEPCRGRTAPLRRNAVSSPKLATWLSRRHHTHHILRKEARFRHLQNRAKVIFFSKAPILQTIYIDHGLCHTQKTIYGAQPLCSLSTNIDGTWPDLSADGQPPTWNLSASNDAFVKHVKVVDFLKTEEGKIERKRRSLNIEGKRRKVVTQWTRMNSGGSS